MRKVQKRCLRKEGEMVMETISLNGAWQVWGGSETDASLTVPRLTAEVPGCALLDLSRHGYLPEDLYFGKNILETEKYEEY